MRFLIDLRELPERPKNQIRQMLSPFRQFQYADQQLVAHRLATIAILSEAFSQDLAQVRLEKDLAIPFGPQALQKSLVQAWKLWLDQTPTKIYEVFDLTAEEWPKWQGMPRVAIGSARDFDSSFLGRAEFFLDVNDRQTCPDQLHAMISEWWTSQLILHFNPDEEAKVQLAFQCPQNLSHSFRIANRLIEQGRWDHFFVLRDRVSRLNPLLPWLHFCSKKIEQSSARGRPHA